MVMLLRLLVAPARHDVATEQQAAQLRDLTSLRRRPAAQCSASLTPRRALDADFELIRMHYNQSVVTRDGLPLWTQSVEATHEARLSAINGTLPVRIYLVGLSHVDPGWLKTFDEYYDNATRHTFDAMLDKLEKLPMRFIWSETCFLQKWWRMASARDRQRFRRLVERNRVEVTNGGHVMVDEATTSLYAILHQFVDGHQWLARELNVSVAHGWSIDPFGHSSSLAYVHRQLGFETMYIQRVHYYIRALLGQRQALHFRWLPSWSDDDDEAGIRCHMSPVPNYSEEWTCSPRHNVCGEYHLLNDRRNRTLRSENDIKRFASILAGEYKRMASLFKHKVYLHA